MSDGPVTMIDTVARALHGAHKPYCDYTYPFEDSRANPEIYVTLARAAIEAMREPTDAMADCAGTVLYGATAEQAAEWAKTDKRESRVHEGQEVWQAMIDAALNEK